MDRAGLCQRTRRRPADGQGAGRVVVRRSRRRLQERRCRRRRDLRRASPPAISRWRRAARWRTGRTASCICTARRRASSARSIRWRSWLGIDAVEHRARSASTAAAASAAKAPARCRWRFRRCSRRRPGAPVMMRISREEEHYIGRARTGMVGRAKAGFTQGRPHHRARPLHRRGQRIRTDRWATTDRRRNAASLIWQPLAMRWRGLAVLTNTPPRSQQRSPGPMQAQRDHGAGGHQGREEARTRPGRDPPDQLAGRQGAVRRAAAERTARRTSPARS